MRKGQRNITAKKTKQKTLMIRLEL